MNSEHITEVSEQELLRGVLEDDARAWRQFYQRYDLLIYRCITRITAKFPALDQEDVAEIHSNVAVNLLRRDKHKLRRFDFSKGSKLGSWIGMIAVQTSYDYLRSQSRQPAFNTITADSAWQPDEAATAFDLVAAREELAQLSRALGDFSELDRRFVQFYYLEEREPVEVASAMSISVKTVYTKKHKLRIRLAGVL